MCTSQLENNETMAMSQPVAQSYSTTRLNTQPWTPLYQSTSFSHPEEQGRKHTPLDLSKSGPSNGNELLSYASMPHHNLSVSDQSHSVHSVEQSSAQDEGE